jgi:hypothetical protein
MNNAAMSIVVDGLPAKPINRNDGQPMMDRDVLAGECLILEFNTTYWQMLRLVRSQVIQAFAVTTVIYTSGTGTFTVPSGVFLLREVELTGGGGGGGGGGGPIAGVGGGGNGGWRVHGPMSVTPGQTISWTVGNAGAAGAFAGNGGDGTDTTFGTWRAAAGKGGHADGNPGSPAGSSNGGIQILSGGQGDAGWVLPDGYLRGGNGGGTASGGNGGNGSLYGGTNGNPGVAPGGGGGGGSAGNFWAGGGGSNGRIIIKY